MLCVASEYYPVGLSPIDNRTGICRNITTGIHLHIMYAETGRSNNFPIYEVLGSRVRYLLNFCHYIAVSFCLGSIGMDDVISELCYKYLHFTEFEAILL